MSTDERPLPYAPELARLRKAGEDAQRASQHLARIRSALTAVDVARKLIGQRPPGSVPLPAAGLLEKLAEDWPDLRTPRTR